MKKTCGRGNFYMGLPEVIGSPYQWRGRDNDWKYQAHLRLVFLCMRCVNLCRVISATKSTLWCENLCLPLVYMSVGFQTPFIFIITTWYIAFHFSIRWHSFKIILPTLKHSISFGSINDCMTSIINKHSESIA